MKYLINNVEYNTVTTTLVTHGGRYHADDVLSTAFLFLFGFDTYARVNTLEGYTFTEEKDIIYDIGFGQFDHHQDDDECFRDPMDPESKFAALGKLWNKGFGEAYLKYVADIEDQNLINMIIKDFDDSFISLMDKTDNFGQSKFPNTLASLVSANASFDVDFIETVDMIKPMFENLLCITIHNCRLKSKALELGDSPIVDLCDKEFISAFLFKGTKARFVISLGQRGGYSLTSVDADKYPIRFKKEDMEGCTFLHSNKFIAAFDTHENALKAANRLVS